MKKIIVSDVTPVKSEELKKKLTFREKLSVASAIDLTGADIINLPALINSKENEVIYRTIAETVQNATVMVNAGDSDESIETAYNCIKEAKKCGLIIAMPVSTALMEYGYHLKSSAMQDKIVALCKTALTKTQNVEFVAKDAMRAEKGFVEKIAVAIKELGVDTITISDEAGDAFPEDFVELVKSIKSAADIKVFVEPNDKISLATACAIEAVKAGADGVKTTMIGSGVSPATLSDVIRAKGIDIGVSCNLDVTKIHAISEPVETTGEEKASDEVKVSDKLKIGATIDEVCAYTKKLGYELSDEDIGKVYEEFKRVIIKTEIMGAREMEAIIASTAMQVPSTYHLVNYIVNSGNVIPPTANIILEKNGEKLSGVSTGDGPVDAAFQAIEQVIGHHYELDDFQIHSVTKGREAVGSALIRLRANGKLYSGNGVSTDIIGACVRAFINAINKIVHEEN